MLLVWRNCLSANQLRCFSAQVQRATASSFNDEAFDESWKTAKPYDSIPGPSTLGLIRNFLPGGRFSSIGMPEVHRIMKKEFGHIYKFNGTFGKRDIVVVNDPKDFEIVYRTEGNFPMRRGLDCLTYYRKVHRKDKYPISMGLVSEQGQGWWDLRHKVNGVMMKPQVTKGYTSAVDEVTRDFVKKLNNTRDVNLETPANFVYQLNIWALESISYITMDMRLGLLTEKPDPNVDKLMLVLKDFFQLIYELDFQPSLWKIYKTPKFNRFMEIMDFMHEVIGKFVDKGLENLKEMHVRGQSNAREKGILEKLYEIDKDIAVLMALDAMLAGVDTTSSGVFMVLYNLATNQEKQDILREELLKILPEKDTPLTKEKMSNMPYLRACVKEALRVTPVTLGNVRTTGRNIVLKGYQIPKETDVFMHNQAVHEDDYYYPDPNSFIPERWLRSEDKHENYNPFSYLPFGFGSRICVGRRLAELEIESLVTRLVRNYHLEWHYPPPEIRTSTINMPQGDIRFRLRDYQ
ncbi:probable cytochrome P450 12b2, mitochondrial [Phlebotomus argentipes]|uniref:probable cytochrome P450 12b2, mitochondrial n=1 Tax=Phlebotomus argentipes TaxID=94469 RepID=UPI002892B300|nr:probable cytochrome P450 12b2, mitochondrial [Phlebotomus argentipes]